jgi:hypothetical protein
LERINENYLKCLDSVSDFEASNGAGLTGAELKKFKLEVVEEEGRC